MNTETLASNLRNAIASNDKYHVGLYGEEACRRLMQQQMALDALKKRQDAARVAISDGRDTEPATGETARETELQDFKQENDWLAGEWVRLLHALGIEDAWRVLDRDDGFIDPPSKVVLNAIAPKPAPDENAREKELNILAIENNWLVNEWLRLFDALNVKDAKRVLDMDDADAHDPSEAVLDAITPKPTPAMEENPEREAAIQAENAWLREEWARVLESLGREDAERILDMEDEGADAPSTVVLDELWKQRVTTTALCSEVARMEPEPAKEQEPEPERKCRTCKWYVHERLRCDIGWDGECHRYPEWSTRIDNDWCGEWEER